MWIRTNTWTQTLFPTLVSSNHGDQHQKTATQILTQVGFISLIHVLHITKIPNLHCQAGRHQFLNLGHGLGLLVFREEFDKIPSEKSCGMFKGDIGSWGCALLCVPFVGSSSNAKNMASTPFVGPKGFIQACCDFFISEW